VTKQSKTSGATFFYNRTTKQTVWSLADIPAEAHSAPVQAAAAAAAEAAAPAEAAPAAASSASSAGGSEAPLPHPWRAKTSKSTGQVFFYNAETKATAWTREEIPL
jgi:hypothetical protein